MTTTTTAARRATAQLDSPVGVITLVAVDGELSGLYLHEQRHAPVIEVQEPGAADRQVLLEAQRQLGEYFAGTRRSFELPVALVGTPFQRRVWAALCEIPYGETTSYGRLAERIGSPGAARAVGLANGRNPVSLVVPCHRVVGSTGRLVGYGGGLARKERLLALEQGLAPLL